MAMCPICKRRFSRNAWIQPNFRHSCLPRRNKLAKAFRRVFVNPGKIASYVCPNRTIRLTRSVKKIEEELSFDNIVKEFEDMEFLDEILHRPWCQRVRG